MWVYLMYWSSSVYIKHALFVRNYTLLCNVPWAFFVRNYHILTCSVPWVFFVRIVTFCCAVFPILLNIRYIYIYMLRCDDYQHHVVLNNKHIFSSCDRHGCIINVRQTCSHCDVTISISFCHALSHALNVIINKIFRCNELCINIWCCI